MKKEIQINLEEGKKIYFASDFHLGIPNYNESLKRERKVVEWLDKIKINAKVIFLMGDLFDFWFEYKTAIPKGYVRLLGKLAEITDSGIPIHLFKGNHDIWAFDYLEKEVGMVLHRKPKSMFCAQKAFYLAHGDGLGPGDKSYKFFKRIFENKMNQWLFRWLHPDIGTHMGLYFSDKSRYSKLRKQALKKNQIPLEKEMLYLHSKKIYQDFPETNYFVFGHRHLPLHEKLNDKYELIVLGDWISKFTYGEFDGQEFKLKKFETKTST